MKKLFIALILMGCTSVPEEIHTCNIDAVTTGSMELWALKYRLAIVEVKLKSLDEDTKERLGSLEDITGGRRRALKTHLIELEDK